VILWRVLPWDPSAGPADPGGALWFPRAFQGAGRHDDPERYGCLYVAEEAVSAVAEALAPFRGSGPLHPAMLVRAGRALALAELELELEGTVEVADLDDPAVLLAEGLRPSVVATRRRATTQAYASRLFREHPRLAALRWWSTLEARWINVTLFDRAEAQLAVRDVTALGADQPVVLEAAVELGLA